MPCGNTGNEVEVTDPEVGFTSDVIRDARRFVGRTDLIRDCVRALNTSLGLIAVYGKRGVGKSSLLRQIQQIALGDYTIAKQAGLLREIPERPRKYVTVYYACDAMIADANNLLARLCNDQDSEDGLLRLVPDDGKQLVEFSRSRDQNVGVDLKVVNWGTKGVASSKYAKVVENDVVQTFRYFVTAIVEHQAKKVMHRDGLLILLDEFDIIRDKSGIGSLIKSLSGPEIKFAICGIGHDLSDLVKDHASVERLIERSVIHVRQMASFESEQILTKAEELFDERIQFDVGIKSRIAEMSQGYPYFTQLIGRACVEKLNVLNKNVVDEEVLSLVMGDVRDGRAFPTLESTYQRAIGDTKDRQILLHLLADQPEENAMLNEDVGRVYLKKSRADAADFKIDYVDQLIPRLVEEKYGVLSRLSEKQGVYEFNNPVFRLYVRLRNF